MANDMSRVKPINASTCLAFATAGLYLMGIATPLGAPQEGSNVRPISPPGRAESAKPTWHSGPASTPPQTEIVLPPSEAPPPAKAPLLGSQAAGKKPTLTKPWVATPAGSSFATTRTPASVHAVSPTPNANLNDDSKPPDPEAQRIQDELSRLRDNVGARRAFYDELRRTVEAVRAGLPDEDSKSPSSSHSAWHKFHHASGEAPNPTTAEQPNQSTPAKADESTPAKPDEPSPPKANDSSPAKSNESPPANAEAPQAFLGGHRGSLSNHPSPRPLGGERPGVRESRSTKATVDRAAYQRVVRFAKANGTPVPLALGVAWIESRMQTHPPRGAAGEVGMFQILPERCRMEGFAPERLKEPEFNAWLGTRLLARYYQEEGSWARAAAKYVAGPRVFERSYSHDLWAYINWYAGSVDSYAGYFARYES